MVMKDLNHIVSISKLTHYSKVAEIQWVSFGRKHFLRTLTWKREWGKRALTTRKLDKRKIPKSRVLENSIIRYRMCCRKGFNSRRKIKGIRGQRWKTLISRRSCMKYQATYFKALVLKQIRTLMISLLSSLLSNSKTISLPPFVRIQLL